MKNHILLLNRRAQSSGIALVLVLSVLVLIIILIVGLLTRATSERTASNAYAATVTARQLSETAINLVQGQITAATTQGGNVTWASQPGMIRTFGTTPDGTTGRSMMQLAYKLYSATNLVQDTITITNGNLAEDLPPADWAANPGIWSDLNEPITVKIGGNDQPIYPILDPKAGPKLTPTDTNLGVEGFVTRGLGEKLPVRWLYVLKDGSLKPGVASGTTVNVAGATAANPITGRIAFWADDDTSKVNINTAGIGKAEPTNTTAPTLNGGTPELYWDVPRFMTFFDRNLLANAQPAKNEFTRYPGHPAWTTLSTVFPALTMEEVLKKNYLPRYQWGGTEGGKKRASAAITLANPSNRLFATVDEFIYDATRTPITYTPSGTPGGTPVAYLPSDLQKLRFFLTANSRAPETNLFNLPKIAIWPVADISLGETYRTAYDRLIAFASSLKGRTGGSQAAEPYFFQRKNAYSLTDDFAQDPPKASPGSQRNLQLYTYLQEMTRRPIPGFGGNFVGKYTAPERDQILTSITDYIRCTNLFDDNLEADRQFTKGKKARPSPPMRFFEQPPGHGQVMPLRHPNGTQGFGRFYSLSEFAIQFICNADSSGEFTNPNPAVTPGPTNLPKAFPGDLTAQVNNDAKIMSNIATGPFRNNTLNGVKLTRDTAGNTYQKRVEAMIHLELFCPALGSRAMVGDTQIRVKGLDAFQLNGSPMGFPADGFVKIRGNSVNVWGGRADGGYPGIRYALMPNDVPLPGPLGDTTGLEKKLKRAPARGFMPKDSDWNGDMNSADYNSYPFLSIPLTVTLPQGTSGTMAFTGGKVTVEIYGNSNSPADEQNLIQTISIDVPIGTFPAPNVVSLGTMTLNGSIAGFWTNPNFWWTFSRDGATPGINGSNDAGPYPHTANVRNPTPGRWTNGRLAGFNPNSQLFTFNSPYTTKGLFGPTTPSGTVPFGGALFRGGPQKAWYGDTVNDGFPFGVLYPVPLALGGPVVTFPGRLSPVSYVVNYCPQGFDVVRSLLPKHGDYRLIAGRQTVPETEFVPHPDWNNLTKMFACNLWENAPLERLPTFPNDPTTPIGSVKLKAAPGIGYVTGVVYGESGQGGVVAPDMPSNYLGSIAPASEKPSLTGDFDNGLPLYQDGPYINKPDEGNASYTLQLEEGTIPYFDTTSSASQGAVLFSPNRIMPSAGMFGSLSTGIQRLRPWQTLLLRPQADHPNAITPPDHLLLDLFWMPVVEPYAISDPFSTAGKVNMNSQLMPFTWIERTTALRAVLKGERMTVVANTEGINYKTPDVDGTPNMPRPTTPKTYRQSLFIDNTTNTTKDDTLQNFHARFATGDIFRSPTEICTLPMVPVGSTLSAMGTYWNDKRLTGDESRERIYTTLLPRLTTKSNSFTVHVRAQALQKLTTTAPGTWVEGKDVVRGEYRGSTAIERYLDPNDESIPNYPTNVSAMTDTPLDRFYKWRQLQTVDFNY